MQDNTIPRPYNGHFVELLSILLCFVHCFFQKMPLLIIRNWYLYSKLRGNNLCFSFEQVCRLIKIEICTALLWQEKNTYYDSFCNKCRSDFLTVVMTTKEGVLSMTLLRNVLTWLPSQQKKLRQHSVLLIWLSDLEDFKSLFWRTVIK